MSVYKRGDSYHYEFLFAGKRIRESAHTTSKTVAKEAEKNRKRELERTLAGLPATDRMDRIKSAGDMVKGYLESYGLGHRAKSILFAKGRLAHVSRLLGTKLLPDITEGVIHSYMRTRLEEGVSGRTINMEVGELSRAIGHPWSILWPKVRKMEERKDVEKALSPEEERRLLDAVTNQASHSRSQTLGTFIRVALMTGMRSGEILGLTWGKVDLVRRVITVGQTKTASGTGRQIPLNGDLFALLSVHSSWSEERFGAAEPGHYLFPFGSPSPSNPAKPMTDITRAWDGVRERAGVECRFHDLRHTAATKMAEAGVPESTMLALMGHMSRAMLERYSHIRMAAKRQAVEALGLSKPRENTEPSPTKSPTAGTNEQIHYA